ILKENLALDKEGVERFYREARSSAKLSHPNIVNIYDIGQEGQIYFIVMEYLPGGTLDKQISSKTPLSVEEVIRIGIEITEALDYAHTKGVIHRDIKAQNIMLTEEKTIKVVDFGIARVMDTGTMTKPGTVMGSVYYFAPEQAEGRECTSSSDIYSTGVLLYYLATGHYPFNGENAVSIALKHIKDEPPSPRSLNSSITDALEMIILKALNKSALERFKTAGEMGEELKKLTKKTSINDTIERLKSYEREEEKTIIRRTPPVIPETIQKKKTSSSLKKTSYIPILLIILILGAGIIFSLPYIEKYLSETSLVSVPALTGKTEGEAIRELSSLDLILKIDSQINSSEIEKDKIISQEPPGGTMVKKNSIVKVIISLGKGKIKVPNIEGKSLEDARKELKVLGLELIVSEEEETDEYLPDTIIVQQPVSDVMVEENSKIKVKISKKLEEIVIPDLTGLTEERAIKVLLAKKLKLKVTGEARSDKEKGLIISQIPEAGEKVQKNSEINVILSSGQELVTVPDITGMTTGKAREKLKKSNLNLKIKEGQITENDNTTIESQSPLPNDKIPAGGNIEVTLIETPVLVTVPDVVGKLFFDAKNDIKACDLATGTVTESISKEIPGTVIAQDPLANTEVPSQSPVNLVIAKLKETNTVIVPDLKGMTVDGAIGELNKFTLKLGNITTRQEPGKRGAVLSQDPPAGSNVEEGTSVNIEINQ
ncbi:MAG TPA: Stk1 family PASTA domain-containing Ser/Thr kinase, partial [Candidatus Eremiobacteraeota bacterium]|nr:Stk1 family PASTA domain-containing Ser/Thr kinase [Candidatus Eremiobacteraeota bacterium]